MINNKIDKSKSFPFISEHSNLFYLKLEQMCAKQFEKQSGYELWHRRLAHVSNRNIRDTNKCALRNWFDATKAWRSWYSDIADLRTTYKLVVLMLDNASEYKSEEMMQFLESKGNRSHFSTPKEQWHNGAADLTINSIMMIARTVMAESGLGGS